MIVIKEKFNLLLAIYSNFLVACTRLEMLTTLKRSNSFGRLSLAHKLNKHQLLAYLATAPR